MGNWESYILDCDIDYGAGYWVVIDWCKNRDKLFRVSIDTLNIYCLVKHYIRYICTTSTRDYHTITAAGKQSYFCWTKSDSLPPLCFFFFLISCTIFFPARIIFGKNSSMRIKVSFWLSGCCSCFHGYLCWWSSQ